MHTHRKYLAAAGVVALAVTMTACGGDDSKAGGGGEKAKKITLVQGLANEPFYISMQCGAQDEAKKQGVTLDTKAPQQWDVPQQTEVVNGVTATKPDAVLIAPVDEQAMDAPLKQLAGNGSKIILVDTSVKDQSIGLSRISSDNHAGGVEAAKTLAKLVGDKGKVAALSVPPGTPTTDARIQGFKDELKNHPGIQIAKVEYIEGSDAGKATEKMNGILSGTPDLAGVFAANLTTGQGAATSLKTAGKTGKVKVVGFDASPKQVEDLKAGTVQALIAQKPYDMGVQGVQQALAAIKGGTVEKQIGTEMVSVTKENVDQPDVAKYLYKEKC